MNLNSFAFCLLIVRLHTQGVSRSISNIEELKAAIANGPNRKIGFEFYFLYNEVGFVLPDATDIVFCGNKHPSIKCGSGDDLLKLVSDGTLLAGMMFEYHPHEKKNVLFHQQFHVFSSSVILPQAILMVPDVSPTTPQGATSERSSHDLHTAINSAIVHVQNKGIDQELRRNYSSIFQHTSSLAIQTCKSKYYHAFAVPNKSQASGLLKRILERKVLKVSIYDKFLVFNEPTHRYYADLIHAIVDELGKLSGPDGEVYGSDIRIEGINASGFVSKAEQFRYVLEGLSDMSAPYHEIDEMYRGTHEPCDSNKHCRPALLPGGTELCNTYTTFYGKPVNNSTTGERLKRCEHPPSVTMNIFRHSCSILANDRHFFVRNLIQNATQNATVKMSITYVTMGLVMGIPTTVAIVALIFIGVLIHAERMARPVFHK